MNHQFVKTDKSEKIAIARTMKALGYSTFQIAIKLNVSKEWLREYAGIAR